MPPEKDQSEKMQYRRQPTVLPSGLSAAADALSLSFPHPANEALGWFVQVFWHDYVPCYVYNDSPVYNAYGEVVGFHQANTIYLNPETDHAGEDLLHELGHAVARQFDLIGHRDNHYSSGWEQDQQRLIGAVTHGRHWSQYLNDFAAATEDFHINAASELWAELFMLFYLYPDLPEADIISPAIDELCQNEQYRRLQTTISDIRSSWQLPGAASLPRGYPCF